MVGQKTAFRAARQEIGAPTSIQDLYRLLECDEARNGMIFDDVLAALEARRSPIVITERKDYRRHTADLVRIGRRGAVADDVRS